MLDVNKIPAGLRPHVLKGLTDDASRDRMARAHPEWCTDLVEAAPTPPFTQPPASDILVSSQVVLSGDTDAAVAFLAKWPTPFIQLTAIHIDPETHEKGVIEVKCFNTAEEARGWIDKRQGHANLYFTVNALCKPLSRKPGKPDISSVVTLHADIDAPAGEDSDTFAARVIEALRSYHLEPGIVVKSGGGVQLFWPLQEPDRITVDGDVARAEQAERYTRWLELDLAQKLGVLVDACHNSDRIMRLPGSLNLPDAKKLAKGRKAAIATVVRMSDIRYPLTAFHQAGPKEPSPGEAPIEVNWSQVSEHESLIKDLPPDTPRLARMILEHQGDLQELNAELKATGLRTVGYNSHSNVVHGLASCLKGYGKLSLEQIAALMRRAPICGKHFGKKNEGEIRRVIERSLSRSVTPTSKGAPFKGGPIVSEFDHMARARLFIEGQHPNLHHYRGDFTDYVRGRHALIEDDTLKADLYGFLDGCGKMVGEEPVPFHPSIGSVNETLSAAKAQGHLLPNIEQPYWLDGRDGPDPCDLVSFPNGIYDLSNETFLPPDPMLFTPNAAGFDYDPKAPDPVNWKEFLKQIYDGEQDQIDSWQEWNGYCVSSDVSQEKGALLIGGKRSGKDTSRHVVQSLLPADAVIGPTLDSMGRPFGMQPFIGKQLAVVGDMRIGAKCDPELLAENVLKITGRGLFTIPRKYKGDWTGTLGTKLMLISNERPKLRDASGALASRFIVFQTRRSFYGQEDRHLFRDKLHPELPGIMLWALDGLRRLRSNGQIAEPKSSVEEREQLERDGSPVLSFVRECLTLDLDAVVPKDDMHNTFCDYAAANGLRQLDKVAFGRDLLAATGGSVRPHRMTDATRTWGFKGANITSRPAARKKAPDLVDLAKVFAVATQKEQIGDDDIPF